MRKPVSRALESLIAPRLQPAKMAFTIAQLAVGDFRRRKRMHRGVKMVHAVHPLDYSMFKFDQTGYSHLSLSDLMTARDLYHVFLMRHRNLVATAIGRYRIRKTDSWPNAKKRHHGTGPRRIDNSEVRPYSWPCILAFVEKWEDAKDFADRPSDMVPSTLFLPDGRSVPVCIIEAPKESTTEIAARNIQYPINNIGAGNPVVARVQGNEYVATVGCLVSDGHRVYAMTNRHVTGDAGEVVWSRIDGQLERIGVSSSKQLTRLPMSALYPNLPASDAFVNLDIGLIDVDDVSRWTTDVRGIGQVGRMVDYSSANLSLSLIGCHVRGIGAASGDMRGEIHGLFYRYKTGGGFEYVADLFIGPRTGHASERKKNVERPPDFATLPGDSGTMWMLEPTSANGSRPPQGDKETRASDYRPIALEWGRNMLYSADRALPQSYALVTLLSKVCALLEVDPVRGWNVDQTDTWGALGHFSIAARAPLALSGRYPKLDKLLENNALIISHDDETLQQGDFKGMGRADFVPIADVPDFFWKPRVGKQGHTRASEGPNHFADMDQPNPDGKTLLDLAQDDAFIDPDKWEAFYDSVRDILKGERIAPVHRGLLPFRVWQLFDAMVGFAADDQPGKFVCAAGVLTHYLGDACQPLHISYLHDGDPERPVTHTFTKGKKEGSEETRPMGQGVHSAYEDAMVFAHREDILAGLKKTPRVKANELVATGFEAARKTIELMRNTFALIPPPELVQTYIDTGKGGKAATNALWKAFGKQTISVMQDGAHLVAVIWESAWEAGQGEAKVSSAAALSKDASMKIVSDPDFVPSVTVDKIGKLLKRS